MTGAERVIMYVNKYQFLIGTAPAYTSISKYQYLASFNLRPSRYVHIAAYTAYLEHNSASTETEDEIMGLEAPITQWTEQATNASLAYTLHNLAMFPYLVLHSMQAPFQAAQPFSALNTPAKRLKRTDGDSMDIFL